MSDADIKMISEPANRDSPVLRKRERRGVIRRKARRFPFYSG